jgi:hypothetical protein
MDAKAKIVTLKMPSRFLSKLPADENEECPICLDGLKDPITTHSCKHRFCMTCVMNTRSDTCPLCRQQMTMVYRDCFSQPFEIKGMGLVASAIHLTNTENEARSVVKHAYKSVDMQQRFSNLLGYYYNILKTDTEVIPESVTVIHCKSNGLNPSVYIVPINI